MKDVSGSSSREAVLVMRQQDERTVALKNGRGTMARLIDSSVGANQIDLHVNRIQPRTGKGLLHYHSKKENAYFILKGSIEVRTPDGNFAAGEGEAVFIPPGVRHAVMNPNDEEALVIEIYSPCIEGDFIEVME